MTKHALVKKKIIPNTDGAEDCSCHEPETQWHVVGMGTCNRCPLIREQFARIRADMLSKVGILLNIQVASQPITNQRIRIGIHK
jgi:hypothetical protein